MWAHPGKQLLFMGGELAQFSEWDHDSSLEWHLFDYPAHRGVQALIRDLNRVYRDSPALWKLDHSPDGFRWIDANDADNNVLSFFRTDGREHVVCVCNLSPVPRSGFRLGLPTAGTFHEVVNSDAETYGGTNVGNMGVVEAEATSWHGLDHSAVITLPPLGVVWLRG